MSNVISYQYSKSYSFLVIPIHKAFLYEPTGQNMGLGLDQGFSLWFYSKQGGGDRRQNCKSVSSGC